MGKANQLKPYDDLTPVGKKRRLKKVAELALDQYDIDIQSLSYLTEETNVFFRLVDTDHQIYGMKIYQEESSTLNDNLVEMMFLDVLEPMDDISAPVVISGKSGERVVVVDSKYAPEPKRVILYRWLKGTVLAGKESRDRFYQAGALMAKIHQATRGFQVPGSLKPKRWDQVFYFHNEKAVYHESKYAEQISQADVELLDQLIPVLNRRLADYYHQTPQLIHGDFNPWNLLVVEEMMKIIDFDDAQMGFPIFDLAIFLFYYRYDDAFVYKQVKEAVFAGYRSIAFLPDIVDYELELLMAARRVNFINYVLYMEEDAKEYIAVSCKRLRDFIGFYQVF